MKIESFFFHAPTVDYFHKRCSFHQNITSQKTKNYILKNIAFFLTSFGLTAFVLKKFPVSSPLLLVGQALAMNFLYRKYIQRYGQRLHQDMRMLKALLGAQEHIRQAQPTLEADPAPLIDEFLKTYVEKKADHFRKKMQNLSHDAQYDLLENFLNKIFLPYITKQIQEYYFKQEGENLCILDIRESSTRAPLFDRPYISPLKIKFFQDVRLIPLTTRLSERNQQGDVFFGVEFMKKNQIKEVVAIPFDILDCKKPLNVSALETFPVM